MATDSEQSTATSLTNGPLIISLTGTVLSPEETKRLLHPLVGGVILFTRNFESSAQLSLLTQSIRALDRAPLMICVDYEGGRVQRFKEGFTRIPAMRELGALWNESKQAAFRKAFELGCVIGRELRAVGIDLCLGPVLDLDWGRSSVIGDRSFSRDPDVVAILASALSHGVSLNGLSNCGKHFPGHGFAIEDSHFDKMVEDPRSLEDIFTEDCTPYNWLGNGLLAVMPAHVIYPAVDSAPAGFSKFWLQDILRERISFNGLIISDDIMMEAAASFGSPAQRASAALAAGCDMTIVSVPEAAEEVISGLHWDGPSSDFLSRLSLVFRLYAT